MIIREYENKDREQVLKCIIELQDFERTLESDRLEGKKMAEKYLDYLLQEREKDKQWIFVSEEGETVVGFVSFWVEVDSEAMLAVTTHTCIYISDLVILPRHRNQGIGEALMKKTEEVAKKEGINLAKVYVLAKNVKATDFYHKMGYRDYDIGLTKELDK